jgi:O-antigen ligase
VIQSKLYRFYILIPTIGCFFAAVISPLLQLNASDDGLHDPHRIENVVFWPLLTVLCIFLTKYFRTPGRSHFSYSLAWLTGYLLLAGASIYWAFSSELSLRRYVQQLMIVFCMISPILTTEETGTVINDLFRCFAIVALINLLSLGIRPFSILGHPGIYSGKNHFGLVAALAFILAFHEACGRGVLRRVRGIAVATVSLILLVASGSKTSLGLAFIAPFLGGFVIALAMFLQASPAGIIAYLCALVGVLMVVTADYFGFGLDDMLSFMFGDPTFTGRTIIWAFASDMIQRRPFLGWGYQSFWLVGSEGPSVREAPSFVTFMADAHNGYLDTVLQTGLIGLMLLSAMVVSTIHATGKLATHHLRRAWLILSLVLLTVLHNGMESTFVRGFDILWLMFLILSASAGIAVRASGGKAASRRFGLA